MNFWENKYSERNKLFWDKIENGSYDFIVPVARKACKLVSASTDSISQNVNNKLFYRDYFDHTGIYLEDKTIAIVDDSVKYGSSLAEYRDYFKRRNAYSIDTFAFIGHDRLRTNGESYDPDMQVFEYLPEEAYQQYLLQQSLFLISKGVHQDIDHIVLEITIGDIPESTVQTIIDITSNLGYAYKLYPIPGIERFTLHNPSFFNLNELRNLGLGIEGDFVQKLRFAFHENAQALTISPLVFPVLHAENKCPWKDVPSFFQLPCQHFNPSLDHDVDSLCYSSSSLYLSVLLARQFFRKIKEFNEDLYQNLYSFLQIKGDDFKRYFGTDYSEILTANIKNLIFDSTKDDSFIELLHSPIKKLPDTPAVLTTDFIPDLLNIFRIGYEQNCSAMGTRLLTHYTLTIQDILDRIPTTHPYALSEAIDENCDWGYMVPCTELKDGAWRRTYRSGEPVPAELSSALIVLAIHNMGVEDGATYKCEPEAVIKLLANFCFDFPSNWSLEDNQDYRYLHTLSPETSHWGTEVKFIDPYTKEVISLYNPEQFHAVLPPYWVKPERGNRNIFITNKTALNSAISSLDHLGSDALFVNSYFKLMSLFREETGTLDALNALALCRNKSWLMAHIIHNIQNWQSYFGKFLGGFSSNHKKSVSQENLNWALQEAVSAYNKLVFIGKLEDEWMPALVKIVESNPLEFKSVFDRIQAESDKIIKESADLNRLEKLVVAIRSINELALVKSNKKLEPDDKIYTDGRNACKSLDWFDVASLVEINDIKHLSNKFQEYMVNVDRAIQKLGLSTDLKTARHQAYYAKRDINFLSSKIIEGVTNSEWDRITFLAIDLTRSTMPERNDGILTSVRGEYREILKKYIIPMGGIFRDPEGDDMFMILFGGPSMKALETACAIQKHFRRHCSRGSQNPHTIEAKFGLSVLEGREVVLDRQMQNTFMGIAKDCCTLKTGFVNEKDILCTEHYKNVTESFCMDREVNWREVRNCNIVRGNDRYKVFRLVKKRKRKKINS